jgi:hypothetical protein
MKKRQWSTPTAATTAARRAGGRRRYNAQRQREMWERRFEILRICSTEGDLPHGAQRLLAERFGVNKSVISRDMTWARKNVLFDPFIRHGFTPRCSYRRRTVTVTWDADDIFRDARNVLSMAQKWLKEAEREAAARSPGAEKLSKR